MVAEETAPAPALDPMNPAALLAVLEAVKASAHDEEADRSAELLGSDRTIARLVIPEGLREWRLTPRKLITWSMLAETWYRAAKASPKRPPWWDLATSVGMTAARAAAFGMSRFGLPAGWSDPPRLRGDDPLILFARWIVDNIAGTLERERVRLDLGIFETLEQWIQGAADAGQLQAILDAAELDNAARASGTAQAAGRPAGAASEGQTPGESREQDTGARDESISAAPERRRGWRARLARGA